MSVWNEAAVTINGQRLSIGQVMALRVACSHFCVEMQGSMGEALGDEGLRTAYLSRLNEVVQLLTEEPT